MRKAVRSKATVAKRASAKSPSAVKAKAVSDAKLGSTAERRPQVKADANAEAADMSVDGCVRVNAGDCDGSGVPNQQPGDDTTAAPVVTGDATATADDLADATACLRINGGDCGTNGDGSGGGTDPVTSVLPRSSTKATVVSNPASAGPPWGHRR